MQTLVIDNMFGETVLMIEYTCDNRPSGPCNPTGCREIPYSHFVFMLKGGGGDPPMDYFFEQLPLENMSRNAYSRALCSSCVQYCLHTCHGC